MSTRNERKCWADAETGCAVTRWTDHASNHLYFTNPGWFDGGRQLLFVSDRTGRHELAAVDLATGDQRAITHDTPGEGFVPYFIAVHPTDDLAIGWAGEQLRQIDLHTGETALLFEAPDGWHGIIPNITADGSEVCFAISEDVGDLGFDQHFEAKPTTKIMALSLTTGACRVVHERDVWMGHVNTSPSDPHLISFCHEGPWTRVEHRVWCCDLRDGRVWKVRQLPGPPACIGHEYWLADGRRIAYHGYDMEPRPVLGIVDVHTGDLRECHQPVKTKHSHSLDGELIVGDGSDALPWILAWRFVGNKLRGPWKVCRHDGGWSEQRRHVHPRIAPDGHSIVFTSDAGGFPRVYSVDLPDHIEALPRA